MEIPYPDTDDDPLPDPPKETQPTHQPFWLVQLHNEILIEELSRPTQE